MTTLDLVVSLLAILGGFCIVLCLNWFAERKRPDALTRYEARFPRTRGFRGW